MISAPGALLLSLALASSSPHAQDKATTMDLAIDGRRSGASFIVHLRMRGSTEGRLTRVSGKLAGSAAAGWRVLAKLDGQSLRVDGPAWMGRVTRSDAFLAVNRYPAIRFESELFADALLVSGGPLSGELTLRGLTRPVSFQLLPSACDRPGRDCDIHVQGSISRQAFGMTAYRNMVRNEVDFRFRVRLRPAKVP